MRVLGVQCVRPLSALDSPKEAVRRFTPSWFTVVMSTGIVGQVIGTFPYDAPGKLQAGWAFWWLSLVLFCIFLAMLIGRFVFFWKEALLLFSQPFQAMFLGAVTMAFATIINGFPTFLIHYWDHDAVMEAAVVLWWIQAALALACTLLLPFFMFTLHRFELEKMSALWLLPILPCVVASGSGGIIARNASVGTAVYVMHMSYLLWGIGIPLCLMIMTIYLRRLMVHSIPPKELVVSSFLPVGPMGMGAVALLNLGAAAMRLYPPPATADVAASGLIVSVTGVVVAFIMWGTGVWWLTVAVCSVCASCRQMTFNIGWWGFVFPLGVFTSAANELWRRLPDLQSMRVVTAVLSCCTIALWAFVFLNTLIQGWNGSLFYAPCLANRPKGDEPPQASGPGLESFPDSLNYCAKEGAAPSSSSDGEDGRQQQQQEEEEDVEAQQGKPQGEQPPEKQAGGAAADGLQRRVNGHAGDAL
ncbi:hypothetical protein CHLNCDRAFT_35385 [Chlorella variabilis]|uniref:C4-dicarboxylate transporter/malic acid transport protein n=1 Tax=Chlorella variabilis TaxID=554065 RepID=E1ZF52_CHLVA|nr:hypothetical protein CHLNCDRAFT_35385 [Chlorella variabilis]EFN55440.1 hypothetical protein CHLNCDRAFT_35385 [Chlorella variabilis]|eukprot:XP_005847542.1 hypothetical protein CHLNCDRAFT_35385 [Chlorella variabilis]